LIIVTNPQGTGFDLDPAQKYMLYGANDVLGTRQAFEELHPRLDPDQLIFYNSAVAFQWPCLAMSWRGIRISERERAAAEVRCAADELAAIDFLNQHPTLKEKWDVFGPRHSALCPEHPAGGRHNWAPRGGDPDTQVCKLCGSPRLVIQEFNPHSSPQCARFLYDLLGLKKVYAKKNNPDGSRPVTTDDEALEKTAQRYPHHAGLLDRILAARGLRKQLGVLRARREVDGRWRSSFNVGTAETSRMSSSKSAYGTGGNTQNVADQNRSIFVADPGLEMFYIDFEQAESKLVAYTSQCPQDIEDHESGNTHVGLARTLFPALPWEIEGTPNPATGRPWSAKEIASAPLPWKPEHDYYRVAKVVRHGTNIGMSPTGIQREIHSTLAEAKALHRAYFDRYPENEMRQIEIRRTVKEVGQLAGPLGNVRRVLGRAWEDDTQRKMLAQVQQSTVAWMLTLAFWRIWYEMDTRLNLGSPPRVSDPNRVWLLAPVHDAILGLYRPGDIGALRRMADIMETPVLIHGAPVVIKAEVAVGKSWLHSDLRVVKL
jgi:hypothetical protein